MQIGFNLPISGPLCEPGIVTRIAREGEALGYDYLTFTDHIVLPDFRVPGYPYSESGQFFSEAPERRYDQLMTAAYIAAKTSRIRLVLAVMVVRSPRCAGSRKSWFPGSSQAMAYRAPRGGPCAAMRLRRHAARSCPIGSIPRRAPRRWSWHRGMSRPVAPAAR